MKRTATITAIIAALTTTVATADTVIHFNTNAPGSPERMVIHGDKVMILSPERQGRLVMDTASGTVTMINDRDKSYFQLDSRTIDQTVSMMDMMKQTMMAQLDRLPPERREALKQQLGLAPTQPEKLPKVEIRPTRSVIKVNGIPCTLTDIITDGQKTAEACVAKPKAAGIPDSDYRTMQKMLQMSRELAKKTSRMAGPAAEKFADSLSPDLDGFPMKVKDLRNGNHVTVSKIQSKKLADSEFRPGKGYRKFNPMQEMQRLMGKP